jgi:type III secretion system needle length determinant
MNLDQAARDFASLLSVPEDRQAVEERSAGQDDAEEAADQAPRLPRNDARRQGGEGEAGDDAPGHDQGDSPAGEPPLLGDAILRGLAGASSEFGGPEVRSGHVSPSLDQIVQQVADRILIAPPGSGAQEVRIQLKESVLPGVEIRIVQQGGQLQVQLVADSLRTQQMLAAHQDDLQRQLGAKLGEQPVVVRVELEAGGQPDRDGRSRNQRSPAEESTEND